MLKNFKIWQTLALLVFLAGLPLGSWYYLREGYQYRKSIIDDLRELGELPDLPLSDFRDSIVDKTMLEEKVFVVSRLENTNTPRQKVIEGLSDQFSESGMVSFVVICPDSSTSELVHSILKKRESYKEALFLIFAESDSTSKDFLVALPSEVQSGQFVLLADSKRQIRRLYEVESAKDLQRLVEHIAIVIPPKRSPKPVLKREIEK